jgi:hypothetical protein
MIEIVIRPQGDGRYSARVKGQPGLYTGLKDPFLQMARLLIDDGADPTDTLVMRREGRDQIGMTATLHKAAVLTTVENNTTGPVLQTYVPFPSGQPPAAD